MKTILWCGHSAEQRGTQVIFDNGAQIDVRADGRTITVHHFTRHGQPGRPLLSQSYPRKEDDWKRDQWPEVKRWEVEVTNPEPTLSDVIYAADKSIREYVATLTEGMFEPASPWTGGK